jgi:hypothetical protein
MEGMSCSGEQPIDLGQLRERLRKMTDEQLLRFGKAARFMCMDKTPRENFVVLSQCKGTMTAWTVSRNANS